MENTTVPFNLHRRGDVTVEFSKVPQNIALYGHKKDQAINFLLFPLRNHAQKSSIRQFNDMSQAVLV